MPFGRRGRQALVAPGQDDEDGCAVRLKSPAHIDTAAGPAHKTQPRKEWLFWMDATLFERKDGRARNYTSETALSP